MLRVCSSCLLAGISIATIGVVFINAEATPTGRRQSAQGLPGAGHRQQQRSGDPGHDAGLHDALGDHQHGPHRDHTTVAEATEQLRAGAIPSSPAMTMAEPRATTGRTQPAVITTKVATTSTAATTITRHQPTFAESGVSTPIDDLRR